MFDLSGKTTLVTGAGSGIGRAIAAVFAETGAMVWVADVCPEGGQETVSQITTAGGSASFIEVDVADPAACESVAERVGALDSLVNNAGIGLVGTILETSVEDMQRMYDVNVLGVFNMSKAFLPGMIERGVGVITNMASIGGVVGVRDRLAYCMSKFAVVGITKTMALDHAEQGIRVNCICPGRVETPFVQLRLQEYPDPEEAYREMSATQALGRMGKPEEVAGAAVYLASDEAAFVTGTTFMIDGGWSAGK
ncbi:MAG: glucose 1-dehydrogenase [Lentisphaerae bacterium]|nr:glucose 1-dehydrogenase [Lentisphaerota bacterium]MBT4821226.1 glucose 1-dehydrogenase [Lentisphaerota bacterium]MBT5607986.1 glucose 1-dehydrogenase [Lentisphaerota bacterium]MBT7057513.1 glucose 1-dehydrogenase [Lentisphaerota bacterium]MBT7845659.1 glucose 1-dehydrogenase [Lentisphaerota bacterium]